jgi:hypothetical protein
MTKLAESEVFLLALKRRQQLARHVAMIHPTRSDQPRQGDAKLVLLKKLARADSHEAQRVTPKLRTEIRKSLTAYNYYY